MLLDVLFRDVHEYLRPGVIEEIRKGYLNGTPLTGGLLLLGAVLLELPLLLVVLARALPDNLNRWSNIGLASLSAAFISMRERHDLDDTFFATVEGLALLAIVMVAWTLPRFARAVPP